MGKEVLKWLTSLALGAATAAVAWLQSHSGQGPAVDPLLSGIIVGALSKLINYLASKLPTAPA
jgi:hypothetical protein